MHPFFDVVAFPWHRVEARQLLQTLAAAQDLSKRITIVYQSAGGQRPLSPGLAADLAWKEVIDLLTMAKLVKKLCEQLLADGQLGAIHPAVRAIVDAPDLFESPLLTSDHVFLDRKPLRGQLKRLSDESSPYHVLLVRGPSGSGKTWTHLLVEHTARGLGADCQYLYPGLVSSVEDVVDNLFTGLGESEAVPPRLETEEAWFKKVCLKLQDVARKKQMVTWVVVDDLGEYLEGPRLDPMIRRFFDQFALSTANPAFSRWFRLVLLDYPDGTVPTKWRSVWLEDRPDENEVDADVLKEYLLQWAARAIKQLGEETAIKLAADISTKVAAPLPAGHPPQPRLRRIHDELEGVLNSL
jgi:hypothetical protein